MVAERAGIRVREARFNAKVKELRPRENLFVRHKLEKLLQKTNSINWNQMMRSYDVHHRSQIFRENVRFELVDRQYSGLNATECQKNGSKP